MYFNVRNFIKPNKPVFVEIFLFGYAILEGNITIHGVTNSIYHTTSYLLLCSALVDHYTTIGCRIDFLQNRLALLQNHFPYLRYV